MSCHKHRRSGAGYELPDGRVIPVTEEELRPCRCPRRAIELVAFVSAAVDPIRIGPGYFQPQGRRRQAVRASKVAVVRR